MICAMDTDSGYHSQRMHVSTGFFADVPHSTTEIAALSTPAWCDTVRICFPAGPGSTVAHRNGIDQTKGEYNRGIAKMTVSSWARSYGWDWVLVVALWGALAILNRTPGHKREFSLTDTSIQHSFAEHERVPPGLLAFISIGIPFLSLVPLSLVIAKNRWDIHNAILGLFMSYTMTGVVTQLIKGAVGRPRPDLIARCLPALGSKDHAVYGLSTVDICTSTNMLRLDDGFKSFPSGHSSLSFAGLGFLACYLAGKMHLYDRHGHRTRAWFALSPLLGGTMVAISRTEDNRHHWQDVLVGSILGMFIAFIAYRTYFPPLSHRECHLPLAPRSPDNAGDEDDAELGLPQRVRLMADEENGDALARASEEEVAWRGGQN